MALSDLQVYNDFTYTVLTEVLAQNVELFNGATNGALLLSVEAHGGDFADSIFYGRVTGLVRRRNPYGDGTIAEKVLNQKVDTAVKVAAGTPPVRMDNAWFAWIGKSPEEAAAAMGQQLARDILADKLNAGIGAVTAALLSPAASSLINDVSGNSGTAALPSPLALSNTAGKFGDAMNNIACWVMHSKSMVDLYGNAISNNERLFSYGNVAVTQDPFGRRYVMADIPGLSVPGSTTNGTTTPTKFHTLGLAQGAVDVMMQNDYYQNILETNGNENIHRTFQAEWSYMLSVKGFSWDKVAGGKAPNDAAINTSTNWDQVVTSLKDGPGVMLISQ